MLDFTQREKKYLPVKLYDGTIVLLGVPKKKLYTKIVSLKKLLEGGADIENAYDEIAEVTAEVLSNNKAGKEFTAKEVDDIMDIEDMSLIILEYGKFAGTITSDPN